MDIITEKSFKYDLEKLDSTSDEFLFVKKFYDTTTNGFGFGFGFVDLSKLKNFQIYKVIENNPIKEVEAKRNNLMLFHGTSRKGATGILKEGFKNSEKGWFGQGVYMTDCSNVAFRYSVRHNNYFKLSLFVNEVLESEKLQTCEINPYRFMKDIDTPLRNQFSKHIDEWSPQATLREDYKEDHKGRRYRNVRHNITSARDEYVADESVTIPRYLIASS